MNISEQEILQAIVRGGKECNNAGFYTWSILNSHEDPDGTFYQTVVRKQIPWENLPEMCEIRYLKEGSRVRILCKPDTTGHVLEDYQNPFVHWTVRKEVEKLFPKAKITANVRRGSFGSQGKYHDTANLYIDFKEN